MLNIQLETLDVEMEDVSEMMVNIILFVMASKLVGQRLFLEHSAWSLFTISTLLSRAPSR